MNAVANPSVGLDGNSTTAHRAQPRPVVRHPSAWSRLERLHRFSMFATGAWLIALVTTSLVAAALTLYAAQLQARMATLTINGRGLSVWRATHEFEARDRAYQAAAIVGMGVRRRLAILEAEVERQAAVLQQAMAKAAAMGSALETERAGLLAAVTVADATFADGVADEDGDQLTAAVKARTELATNAPVKRALSVYDVARQRLARWQAAEKMAETQLAELQVEAQRQATELRAATTEVEPPPQALAGPGDAAARSQATVDVVLYEVGSLNNSWWGRRMRAVALLPSDFLVLMLVSAMGLLGSSLQIIYLYFTDFERRPINFYLIRPCFGIITAFVVYVVAKAGVPLIADPARLGGNAPVNPWFVAFLAIISGLLSERAIATLLAVGATYFRGTEAAEPARWARNDLRPLFEKAGRDPEVLRGSVKAETDEWDGWLQGHSPVPSPIQTIISAVLQQPKRDLFSDIPPIVPTAASPADRIRDYYRTDAASRDRVQDWLKAKGISEPVAVFLRSSDRTADRASLAHDLQIST